MARAWSLHSEPHVMQSDRHTSSEAKQQGYCAVQLLDLNRIVHIFIPSWRLESSANLWLDERREMSRTDAVALAVRSVAFGARVRVTRGSPPYTNGLHF